MSSLSSDSSSGFSIEGSQVISRSSNRLKIIVAEALENSPKILRFFLPLLELAFLIEFIVLPADSGVFFTGVVRNIFGYSQIALNPFSVDYTSPFLPHFFRAISAFYILLCDLLVLYLFFRRDGVKWISSFIYFNTKIIGTILFFPLVRLFSSIFRINFESSQDAVFNYPISGYENVIQYIIYIPALINVLLFALVNWGLMYQRRKSCTDTIEGRFNVLRLFGAIFLVLLTDIFFTNSDYRIITSCFCGLTFILLFIVHLRFLPYLSKFWTVLVSGLYGVGFTISVFAFTGELSDGSYYSFLSLLLVLLAAPLFIFLTIIRIVLIYVFYFKLKKDVSKRKTMKRNCLLQSWDPYDFAIICHWTGRYDDYEKVLSSKFDSSHRAHIYFLELVLGKNSYIYKCGTFLNKMEKFMDHSSLSGLLNLDINFRKLLVNRKIKGLQEIGHRSSSLFEKDMRKLGKTEKKLRSFLKVFWRGLLSEEQSIEFGIYPSLITRIEDKMRELESTYNILLKKYKDKPDFLRKYGAFKVLMNEETTGNLFLDLAVMREQRTHIDYEEMQRCEKEIGEDRDGEQLFHNVRTCQNQGVEESSHESEAVLDESNPRVVVDEVTAEEHDEENLVKSEERLSENQTSTTTSSSSEKQDNIDNKSSEGGGEILDDSTGSPNGSTVSNQQDDNSTIDYEQKEPELPEKESPSPSSSDCSTDKTIESNNNVLSIPQKTYVPSTKFSRTSRSSHTSVNQQVNFLNKKIKKSSFFGIYTLRCLNCCTILMLVGISIFLITMYFIMDTHFSHKSQIVNEISVTENEVTTVRHVLRKMEVSTDPKTVFSYDQSVQAFKEKLSSTIDLFMDSMLSTYENTNSATKHLWSDVEVSFDHFVEYLNDAHRHTNPLLDALTIYGKRSEMVLNLPNNTFYNTTVGYRLRDNSDFSYILLTEQYLQDGIQEFIDLLMADDTLIRDIYIYGLIVIMTFGIFVIFSYCCLYCWMRCTFMGLVKSFALIPKENVVSAYQNFEREPVSFWITKNSSILESFLVRIILFLFLIISLFCVIDGLCIMVCDVYTSRNNEVSLSARLAGNVRQVDSLSMELLYSESSFLDYDEALEKLKEKIHELKKNYETLRFGNGKLSGSDSRFYSIFHANRCDPPEVNSVNSTTQNRIKELECNSLNWLMNLFLQYGHMMELYHKTLTMEHPWYQDLTVLDLYGNNEGILMKYLRELTEEYQNYNQEMLDILKVIFLSVLFLSIPFISVTMCCVICSYPSKIRRNFLRVKSMFLFIPFAQLMGDKNMMNFLTSSRNTRLQKFFKSKNKDMKVKVFESFNYSNSSFLFFQIDRKFIIIRSNLNAQRVFNMRQNDGKVHSFLEFVEQRDTKKLITWMRKNNTKNSFSEEIMMSSYTHHFPVSVEIFLFSDERNKFMVFVKNLEEQRKRDMMRLKKQKSDDIGRLTKCIIPSKIFENLDVEDQNAEYILGTFSKQYHCSHKEMTAVFSDICNFTSFTANLSPEALIGVLNVIYTKFDDICESLSMEKIKTIGDCYFACAGVPDYHDSHAILAAEFGLAQLKYMEEYRKESGNDIHFRVGMSSGNAIAGVLGKTKISYDVFGDTINTASRMADTSIPDKIQVSRSTYEFLFDKYDFFERTRDVQGKGVMKTYILEKRREENKINEILKKKKKKDEEELPVCIDNIENDRVSHYENSHSEELDELEKDMGCVVEVNSEELIEIREDEGVGESIKKDNETKKSIVLEEYEGNEGNISLAVTPSTFEVREKETIIESLEDEFHEAVEEEEEEIIVIENVNQRVMIEEDENLILCGGEDGDDSPKTLEGFNDPIIVNKIRDAEK